MTAKIIPFRKPTKPCGVRFAAASLHSAMFALEDGIGIHDFVYVGEVGAMRLALLRHDGVFDLGEAWEDILSKWKELSESMPGLPTQDALGVAFAKFRCETSRSGCGNS